MARSPDAPGAGRFPGPARSACPGPPGGASREKNGQRRRGRRAGRNRAESSRRVVDVSPKFRAARPGIRCRRGSSSIGHLRRRVQGRLRLLLERKAFSAGRSSLATLVRTMQISVEGLPSRACRQGPLPRRCAPRCGSSGSRLRRSRCGPETSAPVTRSAVSCSRAVVRVPATLAGQTASQTRWLLQQLPWLP